MGKGMKYLVLGLLMVCGILYAAEAEAASVKINKTNFPDATLRTELKTRDSNGDGKLSGKEIRKITSLKIRVKKKGKYGTLDLKGISRLTNLKDLYAASLVINNLSELERIRSLQKLDVYLNRNVAVFDISRMENLTDFSFVSGALQELVIRNNKKLKKLYLGLASTKEMKELNLCENPNLEDAELDLDFMDKIKMQGHGKLKKLKLNIDDQTEIRIEKIPKLEQLDIEFCESVKKLIIGDCPSLEVLWVSDCEELSEVGFVNTPNLKKTGIQADKVKILDMSEMKKLQYLDLSMENLTELVLPVSSKIRALDISATKLKELDLSRTPELATLDLYATDISRLDLTKVPGMKSLMIQTQKRLKKLDFSKLKKLQYLCLVKVKQVKKLNLPNPKKLKELKIHNCKSLKKVNFNKMTNLKYLAVYNNKTIKKLNISRLKKLEDLIWQDGVLKKITWGKKKKLGLLDVSYNKLSGKLDLRKFPELSKVWCHHNRLTSLYGGESLFNIHCYNNRLKKIDMRKSKDLWGLWCYNNKRAKIYLYTEMGGDGGISKDSSAKIKYVKK